MTFCKVTVGIAGLGGLGSNIAAMLARAGVGKLVIADFDVVEKSNLNRQNYFVSHLGMPKTEATKWMLAQTNPDCRVVAHTTKITAENTADIFGGCAVVCEAFDDPEQKAMFANAVLTRLPGVKLVAASGMAGIGSANSIRTRRVSENFYLCGDAESEVSPDNRVLAPRVMLCAAHQANMVLRLLSGEAEP
ncbi:MAG: sulfur carrier protein ThiS adenylyltransferase ThiF [Kiritimatiellaeota bacterium]|nr:sulfur carrier protein ThiS adenylyltransferase ThiF [Kiritimatiellota bacterium]